MEPRRFLFVGGGTGGHLAPALGLAEALRERGHATLFLTSGRAVEADFLAAAGPCASLGVDRSRLPRALALLAGCARARRAAARFRPDVVVGLGGLTGAAALAARHRRPLILLEGNRVIGRGVRLLQRWADATFTLFPETAAELRGGRCIGPIGRRALLPIPAAAARQRLGLAPERPVLFVTGGSQGARDLNEVAAALAPALAARGVQLYAASGPHGVAPLAAAAAAAGLRAVVVPHCADMGAAYSAADLVLGRGGAATVAELWLLRLPAVVVPYPHHADRQQERNARALGGGARVIDDLAEAGRVVLELLDQPAQRAEMRAALAAAAPPDGRAAAVAALEEFATRGA